MRSQRTLLHLLALLPAAALRVPPVLASAATRAPLYSETALANLKHAIVTTPAQTAEGEDAAVASRPRWMFRASGLVFSVIARTPLYGKIKKNAFAKMRGYAESTGVRWDEEVTALDDACRSERIDALVAEAGPAFETPEYYRRPFHAYDEGNLCWEHAVHQPLVSRAVGARNLPGLPPAQGDDNFRGAFGRELGDMLPSDAAARRRGAALLDLGCGTGISTRFLLAGFPSARRRAKLGRRIGWHSVVSDMTTL